MIFTEDIEKIVMEALAAQEVLAGGAYPNRAPDNPPAYPYVVFSLEQRDAEYTSGARYFQYWQVTARAYCALGSSPAILAILQGLHTALVVGDMVTSPPVITSLRNPGEAVVQSYLKTTTEDYEDQLRDGRDVLVAQVVCEILCEGDRTLA